MGAGAATDPTRQVLVFEYDGRPLGVVSFFDLDLDGPERTGAWGFYLDHETTSAEGTAMMAWMQVMKEATGYAFDDEDGPGSTCSTARCSRATTPYAP